MGGAQYQTDADSGLLILGHRYYDPYTGRFISQDPIADGSNWYAYVENNPLTGIDPEGLQRANNVGGVIHPRAPGQDIKIYIQELIDLRRREREEELRPIREAFEDLEKKLEMKAPDNWIIMAVGAGRPSPSRGLGGNPFIGKTAQQIHDRLIEKGYRPAGPDPIGGRGGYVNPRTGRSLHIDPGMYPGEAPHVDVNRHHPFKKKCRRKNSRCENQMNLQLGLTTYGTY